MAHRLKPGEKGAGDFYRITIRDKKQFVAFRNHDVGDGGHLERVAGRRKDGSWDTQAWLVEKKDAHISGDSLVPDNNDVKELFDQLGSKPKHIKGDVFTAKP